MRELLEQVSDFWNAVPCNSQRSKFPVGSVPYFAEIAFNKRAVEPHTWWFAGFPEWKDKYVLELGCGIGTDTVEFARQGARVVAVDISRESLKLAEANAVANGVLDRIEFIKGNMEQLAIYSPPQGWDLIYSFGAIHHTPYPKRALQTIRAYCLPWTEVRIMLYHKRSWKMWENALRMRRVRTEAQPDCPVAYTYTKQEALTLVERAGFHVTSLEVDHIFPYKISEYVEGRRVRRWMFRGMPEWLYRGLERRVGFHILLKAVPR